MCPSYLRSAWGQMMLLGPQINYALQKSCDCPINQGLVVQMLDSGIYLIICYPADKRQGKTNNCVDYICLMDSDSSSVWHLRLNNWGQPYIARRRVKVTTYRQEIQTFPVHVEMYCFGYLMSKHSKRMQYSSIQSLKVNFHRCISQRLCNVLFTTVSHKCQWNTFSVTNHFTLIFFLLLSMIPFIA